VKGTVSLAVIQNTNLNDQLFVCVLVIETTRTPQGRNEHGQQ